MRVVFLLFLSVVTTSLIAQPGTEIYLCDLKIKKNSIEIGTATNITNRKGYDNQPFFHPDKWLLFFVSADSAGRTDIMEFDFKDNATRTITKTHDKEYSPTVTPDKKFLSCILQTDSGAQDLVRYPIEGGPPETLIDNLVVGYHAWLDHTNLVAFSLPQPFKLHWINIETKKDSVLAERIGRSLHRIPRTTSVSFIQRISETEFEIRRFDHPSGKISTIAKSLASVERDMAWTPDGKILMSDDNKLYFINTKVESQWQQVSLPENIKGSVSRMAIHANGKKIAIVVSE